VVAFIDWDLCYRLRVPSNTSLKVFIKTTFFSKLRLGQTEEPSSDLLWSYNAFTANRCL